jgi:hypothetical protein
MSRKNSFNPSGSYEIFFLLLLLSGRSHRRAEREKKTEEGWALKTTGRSLRAESSLSGNYFFCCNSNDFEIAFFVWSQQA